MSIAGDPIRVFPRRTSATPKDPLAFIGDPPLWRPDAEEVHVSVTFTWDIEEGERLAEAWGLYYPEVKIGGPAIDSCYNGFMPGRYVQQGITFTTRGCNRQCPWCLVPPREGKLREIAEFAPGYIVNDNNLLMASRSHMSKVFEMLKAQSRAADFRGGLDARLLNDWVADQLRDLRIAYVFLAADTVASLGPLERALEKLAFLRHDQRRVYVLLAFDGETTDKARARLETVWEMGGAPFAMLYQPADRWIHYSPEWRSLARQWSRPALMARAHGGWS